MATPRRLEEGKGVRFDFIKPEIDYIIENANFNDIQLNIFNRLTNKRRKTINSTN